MNLSEITQILLTRGQQQYDGEGVSQLEHGLQCAYLAEQAKATKEAIAACLLHDLGHLLPGVIPHEYRALPLLSTLFPPTVTGPIKLHVVAKRYLCGVEPSYRSHLSSASQQSLTDQGGIFSPSEAANFLLLPHASTALQLRRWDEQAKIPLLPTPDLAHFIDLIQQR